MIADNVRMCSKSKKTGIILNHNEPVGWCRGNASDTISGLGSNSINIYGAQKAHILMSFDLDTFPPANKILQALIFVRAYKYKDTYDKKMYNWQYAKKIPMWSNTTGFPSTFDPTYVTLNKGVMYFDSKSATWDSGVVTDLIISMIANNFNTLVLRAYDLDNSDFYVQFSEGNRPYIDFTLK